MLLFSIKQTPFEEYGRVAAVATLVSFMDYKASDSRALSMVGGSCVVMDTDVGNGICK